MALAPYTGEADAVTQILEVLRLALPPNTLQVAIANETALNLIPGASDMSGVPCRHDMDTHRSLLVELMQRFRRKPPLDSDLVTGVRAGCFLFSKGGRFV